MDEAIVMRRGPHLNFPKLMLRRTLVTDNDGAIPKIAGASVSENVALRDENWTGCIVQVS